MSGNNKKLFNLVEVALAIGILAVGITGIMALFPLGFEEARSAIAENYVSEAADNIFAYMSRSAYNNWSVLDGIPTSKPASSLTNTTGWTLLGSGIYDPDAGAGIYGLKTTSGEGDIVDFTGEALLWKSKVQQITAAGEDISELDWNDAVAIHLEISWPVEKPYANREKNTYYFELFNYNKE